MILSLVEHTVFLRVSLLELWVVLCATEHVVI